MSPIVTFLAGSALLMLLIFYVGTVIHNTKRLIGTIIIIGAMAFAGATLKFEEAKLGIDLNGGGEFIVELQPGTDGDGTVRDVTSASIQQAIGILEKRLNPNGNVDLTLQPMGINRIQIQMPGIKPEEIATVRQKIEQVAKLEFRLVADNAEAELQKIKDGGVSIGNVALVMKEKESDDKAADPKAEEQKIVVKNRAALDGKSVKNAFPHLDSDGWHIALNFDAEGSKKFGELTEANVNKGLAIIVDNVVISAPTIRSAIYGQCDISGQFTEQQAFGLASALENPLENPMKIISESTVAAAYGEAAIKEGKWSAYIGFAITVLFMLAYYRLAGLIACVGLVLNLTCLFATMWLFDFTLTMPGIAGIVLTMGMAVDANVLIYERMREELQAGKSLAAALEAAFEKAFTAIFDSNLTTLITAAILFVLASGLVKGFAVTLTIGIVTSMFGALIVTRVLFNWFVDNGILKTIKTARFIPERTFDVLSVAPKFIIASLVLTAISFGVMATKGGQAWGIDFRGGAQINIVATPGKELSEEKVHAVVQGIKLPKGEPLGAYSVQSKQSAGGALVVSVKSEEHAGRAIEAACKASFGEAVDFSSVGSVVGDELKSTAAWALFWAFIAIFLYLVLRFEFAFALGASVALFHDVLMVPGLCVLLGQQLSVIHIGAFLTIAGYSINDTIIVFDRIREVIHSGRKGSMRDLMNEAISSTLSRTLLTSLTTLNSMVVLLFFGNPAMLEFAVPLVIGVLLGTYSSIFIASPLVLWWANRTGTSLAEQVMDSKLRKEEADRAAIAAQAGL